MKKGNFIFLIIATLFSILASFYYYDLKGYYDTVVMDDLSKDKKYEANEPSYDNSYNFRWIKIKGELYGETTLQITGSWINKNYPQNGFYRDTLTLKLKQQGVFDTLIRNDYYDYPAQFIFHNIPQINTKGHLKVQIHLGEFL